MQAQMFSPILISFQVSYGTRRATVGVRCSAPSDSSPSRRAVAFAKADQLLNLSTPQPLLGMEASVSRDMRVLIADDQRSVGTSLADLVRCCNHDIVGVVGSGLEAIQAYARHHPDVVLMDYWMPKLNGATACRNIMAKDPYARVILVSGWSPSDDTSRSGAIAMLPKPLKLEQLNATLNSVAETLPTFAEATFFQD